MTSIIEKRQTPHAVSYYDGKNIIQDSKGNFYLIAQVDYSKACLFRLTDNMEWNRLRDAITVKWSELNTDNIGELFNLPGPIRRCQAKITIEIE